MVGIGGKSQRGLFVELTLAFGNPALDALDEENKIDESDNDGFLALCGENSLLYDHQYVP